MEIQEYFRAAKQLKPFALSSSSSEKRKFTFLQQSRLFLLTVPAELRVWSEYGEDFFKDKIPNFPFFPGRWASVSAQRI